MKIDAFGEVDKYLTAANDPILRADERVIGFRQLEYRAYRAALVSRSPLMDERGGWVWQTTCRTSKSALERQRSTTSSTSGGMTLFQRNARPRSTIKVRPMTDVSTSSA